MSGAQKRSTSALAMGTAETMMSGSMEGVGSARSPEGPSDIEMQGNPIAPSPRSGQGSLSSAILLQESESLLKNRGDEAAVSQSPAKNSDSSAGRSINRMGLRVLVLLAVQNCSKNLLMRYVMKEKPDFLKSAAVIGIELLKLAFSTAYILFVEKKPFSSIITFMREDYKNSILLAFPAAAYSLQMTLEFVALSNIDAAVFSVVVQSKLLATASFAVLILGKKIRQVQLVSLVLLTCGVMLCNMKDYGKSTGDSDLDEALQADKVKGITATLGIALSSGFAGVYTEKVIKARRDPIIARKNFSLAFMQVQLAVVSLVIVGLWAMYNDFEQILRYGMFHNFNAPAVLSLINSAIGGLIVAGVLKFADAVLKGYATAISVVMTGLLSMILFDTSLSVIYYLGIANVVCAVLLYNSKNLDQNVC